MGMANLRLRINDWRDKRKREKGEFVEENVGRVKRPKPTITVGEKAADEKTENCRSWRES